MPSYSDYSHFVQLNLFDELFKIHGRQAILFYYQDAETPVSGSY